MNVILIGVITLFVIALVAAIVLFLAAKKFKVEEDPMIDVVADMLPGANCGGCGFAGCRNLAEAIVKTKDLEAAHCPVGGNETANKIAGVLGLTVEETEPKVAVIRCNGTRQNSVPNVEYEGAPTCAYAQTVLANEGGCPFGCVGCGDCRTACQFSAISYDEGLGMPVIDENRCVACGACVKACSRKLIELRFKGKNNRRVYVSCSSKDKGAVAKKHCKVACIGCGKCAKVCPFGAITVENNLAYIDYTKCKSCRKCVAECPVGAITEKNFPPRKEAAPVNNNAETAQKEPETLLKEA